MKTSCLRLLLTALLLPLAIGGLAAEPEYDIVIRNGRLVDGMGNPWIAADVAIRAGRLAKLGRVAGSGRRELDARGKYVSPGWIDMLDQSGAALRVNGLAENKLRQGVTSAIGGDSGIDYVLVNGEIVVDQGRHTGAKPGKVLRGPGFKGASGGAS
jgi:N-acyl-D-amino-acid deacylase